MHFFLLTIGISGDLSSRPYGIGAEPLVLPRARSVKLLPDNLRRGGQGTFSMLDPDSIKMTGVRSTSFSLTMVSLRTRYKRDYQFNTLYNFPLHIYFQLLPYFPLL